MKPFQTLLTAGLALCLLLAAALSAEAAQGPRWSRLGELSVTDRVDHDVLPVTARRGTFTALKLEVFERAVEFHKVVVHFANGDKAKIKLRQVIPAGGESRVIDIPGRRRVIRSIELVYDAQSLLGKSARVRVWGRH